MVLSEPAFQAPPPRLDCSREVETLGVPMSTSVSECAFMPSVPADTNAVSDTHKSKSGVVCFYQCEALLGALLSCAAAHRLAV